MESCSNNDSKSPLPNSVGTKRDASWVGLGIFYFYEKLQASGRLWTTRGCDRNDERLLDLRISEKIHCRTLPLRTDIFLFTRRLELLLIPSLLQPPYNKGTLKPEASALSCLHPSCKLCVERPSGYTQAVGLWNHVLIMIRNPLCPTPLAPKEMLPLYLFNQVSVGDGGVCRYKVNEIVSPVYDHRAQ